MTSQQLPCRLDELSFCYDIQSIHARTTYFVNKLSVKTPGHKSLIFFTLDVNRTIPLSTFAALFVTINSIPSMVLQMDVMFQSVIIFYQRHPENAILYEWSLDLQKSLEVGY